MEGEKGNDEVVVSILSVENDNRSTQIGSQPKEVHRLKSLLQGPTESNSSSPQEPKSSSTAMPNTSLDETLSGESSLPPNPISTHTEKNKKGNVRTTSLVEKVPNEAHKENSEDDDDEEDEIDDGGAYASELYKPKKKANKKWEIMYILEFTICSCIIALFITSLSVPKLRHRVKFWNLEIWRWCVLLQVMFCGRLLTEGFTNVLVFLIERNFVLKKRVLYFVHSLKRSVQVFFWLALVLLTWVILIRKKLKEPKDTTVVLRHITRFLVSSLFGAGLWVVKTLLVKVLACSFHVKRFFDRIQDSIFHQYVLLTLSEPPFRKNERLAKFKLVLTLRKLFKGKIVEKQVIDVERLSKMIKDTVSAWTISGLVNVIQGSGLATISGVLDESVDISNEEDAKRAGNQIFTNVAKAGGRNSRYIDETDLLKFLKKEDVDKVFDMFKCPAESRKIKRTTMRDWVVKVYKERELLSQSIKDAKTAIEEMNRILSGLALIVIFVVWLVLMGLATTQMLIFVSSQLLVATFIFGNSCKIGFECIVFIFVMHPYDVGDHCIIDGVQMIVEEMNILTTLFKSGKETIVYPNSVLATKPISNLHRSPDTSENVEFAIDLLTSADTIAKLKSKIKLYIEKKDKQWYPDHKYKEIKDGSKLKMVLYVNPKIDFQEYGENSNRTPELLIELKDIFEELEINYHYLPQQVHLSNIRSEGQ